MDEKCFRNFNGYEVKDAYARKVINRVYTPEAFGAVGDGETDDSAAIQAMFDNAKSACPDIVQPNEGTLKDFTGVKFLFAQKYAISNGIVMGGSYGLELHGLNLIARDDFDTSGTMLTLYGQKNTMISDSVFNGNYHAGTCLKLLDYTLAIQINNCTITRFLSVGLHKDGSKGHEILANNCKINQVEWGETDKLTDGTLSNGIGIYLNNNSYDNNFTNIVVCYCKENTVVSDGGSTTFCNCHFYGAPVKVHHSHTFQSCYFDYTQLLTGGHYNISGCTFTQGEDKPAIVFHVTDATNWCYETAIMCANKFYYDENGTNVIDTSAITNGAWKNATACANYFQNCKKVHFRGSLVSSPNHGSALPRLSGNGYVTYGDLQICYGEASADGEITMPTGSQEFISHIGVIITPMEAGAQPYATDFADTKFTLGGTNGKRVKWVAVGRMWSGD